MKKEVILLDNSQKIAIITDNRVYSPSATPGFYGQVYLHLILPAVSEEQKYEPAQEIFFSGEGLRELHQKLGEILNRKPEGTP